MTNLRNYPFLSGLFLAILFTMGQNTFAQSPSVRPMEYEDLLPDFQHLSPEMSSLGEYGETNMNHYTGTATISIPLFSCRDGGLEIPISLSYVTGGVRVNQEASTAGLGWSLSCGGHIARIVNGLDDSLDEGVSVGASYALLLDKVSSITRGLFTSQRPTRNYVDFTLGVAAFDNHESYADMYISDEYQSRLHLMNALTNKCHVPDIYQASFLGRSFSFVLLGPDSIVTISSDGHRYQVHAAGSYKSPSSITVTDDMGLVYVFNVREYSGACVSGLWLSSVTTPSKESATFSYLSSPTISSSRLYESEAFHLSGRYDPEDNIFGPRQVWNQDALVSQYVQMVVVGGDSLVLTYSDRSDLGGGKALTRLEVRSRMDGALKHSAQLHHGYFMPSTGDGETSTYTPTSEMGRRDGTRLRLDSVVVDGRRHSFGYSSVPLPVKTSAAQDFWGLYNGVQNNGHLMATPRHKLFNGLILPTHFRGEANRHASDIYGEACSLTRVHHPTGGSTVLTYEPHRFTDAMQYHYPLTGQPVSDRVTLSATSEYGRYGVTEREFTLTRTTPTSVTFHLHVTSADTQTANGTLVGIGNSYIRHFATSPESPSLTQVFSDSLQAGTYKLVAYATPSETSGATSATVSIAYDSPHAARESYGGGLRVAEIKNYDSDGTTFLGGRSFNYSGGRLLVPTTMISLLWMHNTSGTVTYEFAASEPSHLAATYFGRPTIGYDEVTDSMLGGDFGHTVHRFVNPYPMPGPLDYYNTGDVWMNGQPQETIVFSETGDTLNHTRWYYAQQRPDDYALFVRCFAPSCHGLDLSFLSYELDAFPKRDDWVYPTKVETTQFYNGIPSQKVTNRMGYDETTRQLSYKVVDYATGCDSMAMDYPATGTLLWNHGMKSAVTASRAFHKDAGGGYVLVGGNWKTHALSSRPDSAVVVEEAGCYLADGSTAMDIKATAYGDRGTIREYMRKDGTRGAVVWAYGQRWPVMRVEGATCQQIEGSGVDMEIVGASTPPSRAQLLSAKQAIESATGALVTLYIYDSSGRVIEVITPSGMSTHYLYDAYGRLIGKKDNELRTLETIGYNYGN